MEGESHGILYEDIVISFVFNFNKKNYFSFFLKLFTSYIVFFFFFFLSKLFTSNIVRHNKKLVLISASLTDKLI